MTFPKDFKITKSGATFVSALLVFLLISLTNIFWGRPVDPTLALLVGGFLGLPVVMSSERKEE